MFVSRITRLTNNRTKSRKRATIPDEEEKATTQMQWLLSQLYHRKVVSPKTRMHSFLKLDSRGETRCRKSWNQFKGYDSLSLRYVKRVSGKRKDHRLEKYKSNLLISVVPTL